MQPKDVSALLIAFFISTLLLLTGCASKEVVKVVDVEVVEEVVVEGEIVDEVVVKDEVSEDVVEEESEIDPYEGFNRKVFVFNKALDDYVAAPVTDVYLWITPEFMQAGVSNFFSNLQDINVVLNDMMQGKVEQGAEDTGRFAVNTTLGLLGLFDVATEFGLEKHNEDFAQTLAVWGVPQGPYLVIPVIGPATTRGVPGGVFDAAANPATYVGYPVQVVQMINARANATGALKFIDEAALDPYVFTRESFLQYRQNLIMDGESEIGSDILDFEDDFYDDEDFDEEVADVQEEDDSEINEEVSADNSQIAKTDTENQLETSEYRQNLGSNMGDFEQTSNSFDGAVKSFDEATRSFEEANIKINQLKD
jgi:phospholipid-binding lipoprotein MlaA